MEDDTIGKAENSAPAKRKRMPEDSEEPTAPATKTSKFSTGYKLCLNCGQVFDPNRNVDGDCMYHIGETEVGELELNPTSEQIQDDEASRETWPNAFVWSCCDLDLEGTRDEACKSGQHVSEGIERTEYSIRTQKERRQKKYYG